MDDTALMGITDNSRVFYCGTSRFCCCCFGAFRAKDDEVLFSRFSGYRLKSVDIAFSG